MVLGEVDVGVAFSKLPFDHLLFTGATSVGKHVMRAAAENLTPVTLELGGKSPAIVSDSVPMKDAAERIAFGKSLNAGQTCVAPDYVLVPSRRVEEFVSQYKEVVQGFFRVFRTTPTTPRSSTSASSAASGAISTTPARRARPSSRCSPKASNGACRRRCC